MFAALIFIGLLMTAFTGKSQNAVTDYDGNLYHSISIGKQVWLTENLRTTHYNDGSPITYNETWTMMTEGAYGLYDDDTAVYKKTYGTLYNWYAVNSGKLCPKGWHVPTEEEWTTLITFLGGESSAGEKMKVPVSHVPAWDGNNSSGFSALPSGQRSPSDGVPSGLNNMASFWSSTENGTGAWYHTLYTSAPRIGSAFITKTYGFSVRCIKD
jgi:uncharacterized protein (TIGR02145 family)